MMNQVKVGFQFVAVVFGMALVSDPAFAVNYQAGLDSGDAVTITCPGKLIISRGSNSVAVARCVGSNGCRITKDMAGNYTLTVNGQSVFSGGGWSARSTCEEMAQENLDSGACQSISKNY